MDEYITVKEAQELLGCCSATIYNYLHSDDFPTLKKKGLKSYVMSKADFLKWCERKGYSIQADIISRIQNLEEMLKSQE